MTTVRTLESNPFALMMDPDAVFAAMASSERLARLQSRICRPLDKLVVTHDQTDAAAFDEAVDADARRGNAEG